MDQNLVAAVAMVGFFAFALVAYICHEERKSRVIVKKEDGPDTVETRSRRAF